MNIYQDSNNTISTILYAATEERRVPFVLYKDKEQTKPISRKELHDLALSGQILVSYTDYDLDYGYKSYELYIPVSDFLVKYSDMGSGFEDIVPESAFSELVELGDFGMFKGADHTIDVFGAGNSEDIDGWQDILTVYDDKIYGTVNGYMPTENGGSAALMIVYLHPSVGENEVEDKLKLYGIDGKELYFSVANGLCVYLGVPFPNTNKMAYQKLTDSQVSGYDPITIPFLDSLPKKDRKFEIKIKLADGSFQTTTYDCSNVNLTFSKLW